MVHKQKKIKFGSYLGNIWYAQDKFTREELKSWRKHYKEPRLVQAYATDVKKYALIEG